MTTRVDTLPAWLPPEGETVRLYVLHLNPESRGTVDRYAVMRIKPDGDLDPLWGDHVKGDDGREEAKAWPYMVWYPRPASGSDRYPAFHFKITGGNFSKLLDLAEALHRKLRRPIALHPVNGYASRAVTYPQES